MRVNSINSTLPKFKGVREDRNTISQLKENNGYSLTEPNQRRINKALANLAQQRGEENIRFLLNVADNLTYQTNIANGKVTKNDWKGQLKEATRESMCLSDPIISQKYEPEFKRVFLDKKELNDDEKKIIAHRDSIMKRINKAEIADNPNENIRDLENNIDYFITSTETPTKEKAYVMERLDYMMSPEYKINPQLENKKTKVLAEMMNDMVINTPNAKIPNMKAVNQKTHGMCAAISIARKAVAYESKSNYVDSLLSELDNSDKIMVYDRLNLGSGKRVPVDKTYVDFDYAQEKGYRIIDASTLQWMGIAGMYGSKNEKLHDFFAFDKQNFDAFHDSFFVKNIEDETIQSKQNYFQSLVKAKDEIENVKADKILKDIGSKDRAVSNDKNMKLIQKYNESTVKQIKTFIPDVTKSELRTDMLNLQKLYVKSSEQKNKVDENIRKYSFIPNEEHKQKENKIVNYFTDKYGDRIKKDVKTYVSNIISNTETVSTLGTSLTSSNGLSKQVANARKLYTAEATYRASIVTGLSDNDILDANLIKYNIPDNETRILKGYESVINRIENKDDKKMMTHFSSVFGTTPDDKEGILDGLNQVKEVVNIAQTEFLDELYGKMLFDSRQSVLFAEINASKTLITDGDKDELNRMAEIFDVKEDKKIVLKELEKLAQNIESNPNNQEIYKFALNRMGIKSEMRQFVEVYQMFIDKIQDVETEEGEQYRAAFKQYNGLPEDASYEEVLDKANSIGMEFNNVSQSVTNAEEMLNVQNEDGSIYYTVNGAKIVMKKMENEGKLVSARDMAALQDRFTKIDKLRSSDEFASRQGKISDPSLYKMTPAEKEAIKKIGKKINSMYSEVIREHTNIYREIKEPLEKHAKRIGTNEGKFWVGSDGHSGLYGDQQVKIFEQLTDKPYQEITDTEKALDMIKNGASSGISSTSVFHNKNGWHAQYVVDVKEVGKDGRTAVFHDNTWGASEHENTWVDSEGLTRTDYSDYRGGEFGYMTDENWHNGNYVDNLTRKAGKISSHDVDSKAYKKIRPKGEDYDFSTVNGIIVQGVNPAYKDIAGAIKDTIFLPDSAFVSVIKNHASNMTVKEVQKAIFSAEVAGKNYKSKLEKIDTRLKGDMLHKGIESFDDYNKLSEDDPIKVTFEKAAIRLAYPDAIMYEELAKATSMKNVLKVRDMQMNVASNNFNYAFGKSLEILNYLATRKNKDFANIVVKALQDNSLDVNAGVKIAKGVFDLSKESKVKFDGSMKTTIGLVLDNLAQKLDENIDNSSSGIKAKSEIMNNTAELLKDALYFNKEDLKLDTDKAVGIRNWIDEKFNPITDEQFVEIYRNLQDMTTKDFEVVRKDVTPKQMGMSVQTGYDLLQKYKAVNEDVESTVRNILFYEEYINDANISATRPSYKYEKTDRKTRGAFYVGSRTFDDLYRSMNFSLSTLTYDKMFNKYKDRNFRKYGAFPAYPEFDKKNNKGIKEQLDTIYNKTSEIMDEIFQKKVIKRDYQLVDEIIEYKNKLNPTKSLTTAEIEHMHKLAGEFILLNMEDDSIPNSTEAAYNLLELNKEASYDEIAENVDVMAQEFEIIKKANSAFDLDVYNKNMKNILDGYTDAIINYNIPVKYQHQVKAAALKWQDLELKLGQNVQMVDEDKLLLKSKIDAASLNPRSENQINSFDKIETLVFATRALYENENVNKLKIKENEAKIAELTEKYVEKYIKDEKKLNIMSNIKVWSNRTINENKGRIITEEQVLNARYDFEKLFKEKHFANNPTEILSAFLVASAKDAKDVCPKQAECVNVYEGLLKDELEITRFIDIQESLMEAVQTGNTAHVKNYFDDYYIDIDGKLSLNSNEAIDYMIKCLLVDDNTKTAKMFVEKLGLGDRVLDIESESLKKMDVKSKIDKQVKFLNISNLFVGAVTNEINNLSDRIEQSQDPEAEFDVAKQNIIKTLYRKPKNKTMVNIYMGALDEAKKYLQANPTVPKGMLVSSVHSQALQEVQNYINDTLQGYQEEIDSINSLYKFLLDLRLPEYSEGYKKQEDLRTEFNAMQNYAQNEIYQAVQENSNVQARLV